MRLIEHSIELDIKDKRIICGISVLETPQLFVDLVFNPLGGAQ